jgi:hypothetical protein
MRQRQRKTKVISNRGKGVEELNDVVNILYTRREHLFNILTQYMWAMCIKMFTSDTYIHYFPALSMSPFKHAKCVFENVCVYPFFFRRQTRHLISSSYINEDQLDGVLYP